MTTINRKIRGIRDSIPQGYVIGRASQGSGPPELLDITRLRQMGIADSSAQRMTVPSLDVLANPAAAAAAATGTSVSGILDFLTGTAGSPAAQGSVIYRSASGWVLLAPGTSGNVLTTNGASADPSWTAVSGGGGGSGAITLITETVTSGTAASVTFSSIASTYRDLIVKVRGRGTSSVTNVKVMAQANGDTGTNYTFDDFHAYASGTDFTQYVAQTSMNIGEIAAATAPANYAGTLEASITDYRGTTFNKAYRTSFGNTIGTGSFAAGAGCLGGSWLSTAAITSLKIFPITGSFVNGTVVSLYGSM